MGSSLDTLPPLKGSKIPNALIFFLRKSTLSGLQWCIKFANLQYALFKFCEWSLEYSWLGIRKANAAPKSSTPKPSYHILGIWMDEVTSWFVSQWMIDQWIILHVTISSLGKSWITIPFFQSRTHVFRVFRVFYTHLSTTCLKTLNEMGRHTISPQLWTRPKAPTNRVTNW